jgi:hypothetical protein
MYSLQWCKDCVTHHYNGAKCYPLWEVWRSEDGYEETRDDARKIRGYDAESAVERWAEEDDCGGDYCIVGGSPATVCVALEGSDEVARYYVSGETVPSYSATELEVDDAK